jgi:hypothetical protein
MSDSIKARLDALEAALKSPDGVLSEQWTTLREQFTAASSANGVLLADLAIENGTRNLPNLLKARYGPVGELRRRLGRFCQDERIRCPGARVVKARSIGPETGPFIFPSGDGGFLQIISCPQTTRETSTPAF